jgi:hypothetical protein
VRENERVLKTLVIQLLDPIIRVYMEHTTVAHNPVCDRSEALPKRNQQIACSSIGTRLTPV